MVVALEFSGRSAGDVASGRKRRSIRARYVDPGERLWLINRDAVGYAANIGDAVCKSCDPVAIGKSPVLARGYWVRFKGVMLTAAEADAFAIAGGFADMAALVAHLSAGRGLPAAGWVITW